MDANQRVAQRAAHSDAQITLENVACVNTRTHLHPNRQQETCNTNCQAHQGQQEQLPKERRQEIQNADCHACNAQCELDRTNQGGNQVIPLGEMTIVCGKCGTLHFLEEHAASSSHANSQFTLCCA